MTSGEKVFKWGIFERPKIQTIQKGNTALLGDAAHPMVPFMGQGGCMALDLDPVEVILENQKKLEARYGKRFTIDQSEVRAKGDL